MLRLGAQVVPSVLKKLALLSLAIYAKLRPKTTLMVAFGTAYVKPAGTNKRTEYNERPNKSKSNCFRLARLNGNWCVLGSV